MEFGASKYILLRCIRLAFSSEGRHGNLKLHIRADFRTMKEDWLECMPKETSTRPKYGGIQEPTTEAEWNKMVATLKEDELLVLALCIVCLFLPNLSHFF